MKIKAIEMIQINNQVADDINFSIETYVQAIIIYLKIKIEHIEITFLNSTEIATMNRDHFNNFNPTDTISFNLGSTNKPIGDIYLCSEKILNNSKLYQSSFEKELKIVIIHSVLHLLGYTDNTEKAFNEMAEKQQQIYDVLGAVNEV